MRNYSSPRYKKCNSRYLIYVKYNRGLLHKCINTILMFLSFMFHTYMFAIIIKYGDI